MKKILLIRFSALGDVAMLVPVIKELAAQHSDIEVTVLSQPFLRTLFCDIAPNIKFIGADVRKDYKGISGLNRLYSLLRKERFDAVADMHDVLRSKYLRLRFLLSNLPCSAASSRKIRIAHIDKHRAGKKALTRDKGKVLVQQPTSFDNYREVLTKLGLPPTPALPRNNKAPSPFRGRAGVGIAPFAAHKGKIYPIEKMEEVVNALVQSGCKIYLFGAGREETDILHKWQTRFGKEHITVVADIIQKNLKAEIELMGKLDVMLTMDSGNQHLAALSGTRVISIWGATHPYAGFLAYGQSMDDVIQKDLPCRPCSIYGNKPCKFGNYPCLNNISPKEIVDKILT